MDFILAARSIEWFVSRDKKQKFGKFNRHWFSDFLEGFKWWKIIDNIFFWNKLVDRGIRWANNSIGKWWNEVELRLASQPRVLKWTNDATHAAWLAKRTSRHILVVLDAPNAKFVWQKALIEKAFLWGHERSVWLGASNYKPQGLSSKGSTPTSQQTEGSRSAFYYSVVFFFVSFASWGWKVGFHDGSSKKYSFSKIFWNI